MRWFPFVSREHHEAVLHEKEQLVVELRAEVARLEKRLEQPIPVNVTLPKDLFIAQQAIVTKRKKRRDEADAPTQELARVDLANCDENDLKACAVIAVAKNGRKAANQWELQQFIRGVQTEIRAAKADRRRKLQKAQQEEQPAPKIEEFKEGIELDEPVDESAVPAHIRELVARAEGGQ